MSFSLTNDDTYDTMCQFVSELRAITDEYKVSDGANLFIQEWVEVMKKECLEAARDGKDWIWVSKVVPSKFHKIVIDEAKKYGLTAAIVRPSDAYIDEE